MLHPNCSAWVTTRTWKAGGPAGQLIHSMQFYETNKSCGRPRRQTYAPPPRVVNTIEAHRELDFDKLWGPAIHDVARVSSNGILWAANTEDLPEEHNRVTLSPNAVDSAACPHQGRVHGQRQQPQTAEVHCRADGGGSPGRRTGSSPPNCGSINPGICSAPPGWARPDPSVVDSFGSGPRRRQLLIADGTSSSPRDRRTRPAPSARWRCGSARKSLSRSRQERRSHELRSTAQPGTRRLSVPTRVTRPPRPLCDDELATLLRAADCLIPASGPNPRPVSAGIQRVSAAGSGRPRRRLRHRAERDRRADRRRRSAARGAETDVAEDKTT